MQIEPSRFAKQKVVLLLFSFLLVPLLLLVLLLLLLLLLLFIIIMIVVVIINHIFCQIIAAEMRLPSPGISDPSLIVPAEMRIPETPAVSLSWIPFEDHPPINWNDTEKISMAPAQG